MSFPRVGQLKSLFEKEGFMEIYFLKSFFLNFLTSSAVKKGQQRNAGKRRGTMLVPSYSVLNGFVSVGIAGREKL